MYDTVKVFIRYHKEEFLIELNDKPQLKMTIEEIKALNAPLMVGQKYLPEGKIEFVGFEKVYVNQKSALMNGNGVEQRESLVADNTFLLSPKSYESLDISGKVNVQSVSVGGTIGWVVGVQDPLTIEHSIAANLDYDLVLILWQQSTKQNLEEGFHVFRINATNVSRADLTRFIYLQNINLGSSYLITKNVGAGKGWAPNTEYKYDIKYTNAEVMLKVDGVEKVKFRQKFTPVQNPRPAEFKSGRYGFYTFSSMAPVRYTVSDGANIDFTKLVLSKDDLVTSLNIPTSDTLRASDNILQILDDSNYFFASVNNLSELTNTADARRNIGLGPSSNVIFDTITANKYVHSSSSNFTGVLTANFFIGDGYGLYNVPIPTGNVTAEDILDDRITSQKIVNGTLIDEDFMERPDLRLWEEKGWTANGNWNVDPKAGNFLVQTTNGLDTFYVTTRNYDSIYFAGQIEVATTADDDLIGWVLGFTNPNNLVANNNTTQDVDFIVIGWKQNPQSAWARGLHVVRVKASQVTARELYDYSWRYTYSKNQQSFTGKFQDSFEITTNATVGGWKDNTKFNYELLYTNSSIQLWLDGKLEINVKYDDMPQWKKAKLPNKFPGGKYGYFNNSQHSVYYYAPLGANIAFHKLNITKDDLVTTLNIPTADTHIPTANVLNIASLNGFLVSGNNLSDLRSTYDARNNIGLGDLSDVTFNNLSLTGYLSGLDASVNNTINALVYAGDGSEITNIDGSSLLNVTADDLDWNIVTGSTIVTGSLMNVDFMDRIDLRTWKNTGARFLEFGCYWLMVTSK